MYRKMLSTMEKMKAVVKRGRNLSYTMATGYFLYRRPPKRIRVRMKEKNPGWEKCTKTKEITL